MSTIDYGYPWWLSYGHLSVFVPAVVALLIGRARRWPLWLLAFFGVLALWAGAAFFVVRSFAVNGEPALPTQNFLRSGEGKVLDIGAGTGRSSIMVLKARPKATLVASDLFAASFDDHFGKKGSPQDRLLSNLMAAGVADRATIATADMRKLPFDTGSFDALVSAYAVDHVGRDGAKQALAEAFRVVKPGGDFLLILVANDASAKFAYGPMLTHGGTRGATWWKQAAAEAGFQTTEEGTSTATLYLLLKKA